jgi:DNA-binding FadR family transcriptional regulator
MSTSGPPIEPIRRLGPADRGLVRERVVMMLTDAIRAGAYSDGDRLPSGRTLAAEMGVSRAIVSAAIDELAAANVLESRRGRHGGTFVVSASNIPPGAKRVEGTSPQVSIWLLEAREAVETAAVMLASERAQVSDLRELQRLRDQLAGLTDQPRAYAETGFTLIIRIAETTQNPFIVEMIRGLVNEQATLRAELKDGPSPKQLEGVLKTFDRILASIMDGDKDEIREAVAAHMRNTRAIYT